MTKSRKHTFTIAVTFDKQCTKQHALLAVRDTIHGEFYPTQRDDSEPGSYRVSSFAKLSKRVTP